MDALGVAELRDAVANKLAAYGARLPTAAVTRRPDGDVVLTIGGDRPAAVVMQDSSEVFVLELGTCYSTGRTAYDDETKLETIDDLLEELDVYLEGRYHEKVYESASGEELHRDLYLGDAHFGGSHSFPRAQLRRLRAKRSYIVTP